MGYDSRPDTREHISHVRDFLSQIIQELWLRWDEHDKTKLEEPELSIFDEYTPKLKDSTYGSDEYKQFLAGMKEALDHHYAAYRHHPEHFERGIGDMNLIDLMEMLADWKAATMRHTDGNLESSIYKNAQRFGYGDEIEWLLMKTARDLGWI